MRREYWFLTVAVILILCVGIFFNYYGFKGNESLLISIIGGIITFVIGYSNYQIADDQMFKDLFQSFNEQYSDKINELLNIIRNNPDIELKKPEERNQIIDYFNLCAEEYLWRTKKRIPKKVWKAWKAGIELNLKIPQVKEVFLSEISTEAGRVSYYGLAEELGYKKVKL